MNQSEKTTLALGDISEVESGYKKILGLRKAIDAENKMTNKFNLRLEKAYKSNWKLNSLNDSIDCELDVYEDTVNVEMDSIECYKEQIKHYKNENEQFQKEKQSNVEGKILSFEEKFLNAYTEYDSKNLMINIQEYHERIKNKRTEINNFTSVERNLQQKLDIALKKLDDDKVSTYVCNFILNEDNDVLTESHLLEKSIRDAKIKLQQNEETIQQFSKEKLKH